MLPSAYLIPGLVKKKEVLHMETARLVIDSVQSVFGLEDINAHPKSRKREHSVWPRQIAHALLKEKTKLPYEKIGKLVGGKDHSTAIYSVAKIKDSLDIYRKTGHDDLAMYYEMCKNEFEGRKG